MDIEVEYREAVDELLLEGWERLGWEPIRWEEEDVCVFDHRRGVSFTTTLIKIDYALRVRGERRDA